MHNRELVFCVLLCVTVSTGARSPATPPYGPLIDKAQSSVAPREILTLAIHGEPMTALSGGYVFTDAGRIFKGWDKEGREVSIASMGSSVSGELTTPKGTFAISPFGKGLRLIPGRLDIVAPDDGLRGSAVKSKSVTAKALPVPEPTLDVLMVYDPALETIDGPFHAFTEAALTQDYLDDVFANSGISVRPRLVGLERLDPKTQDLQIAVERLNDSGQTGRDASNDPDAEPVRSRLRELRAQYHPDLVAMLMKSNKLAISGLGYVFGGPDYAYGAAEGITVNASGLQPGGGTFAAASIVAHEIGHNLGAAHVRPDPGPFKPYGYGYKCGDKADVMASGYVSGIVGTVKSYSSPNVFNGSIPCGIAPGQPDEADIGTMANESLAYITNNAPAIARVGTFDVKPLVKYVSEPAGGSTQLPLVITRTGDSSGAASVQLVIYTEDDPAFFKGNEAADDFGPQNQRVSFAAGETQKTVNVSVASDGAKHRVDRSLRVQMLFPIGSDIGAVSSVETALLDRDHEQQLLGFRQSTIEIAEGSTATVEVLRPGNSGCAGACYYGFMAFDAATVNGGAVAGKDFTALSQSYLAPTGRDINGFAVDQRVMLPVTVSDNGMKEGAKTFTYKLTGPQVDPSKSTLMVTILDDEDTGLAQFTNASASFLEGSTAIVEVSRTRSSNGTLSVPYEVRAGSAVAGSDFTPSSGVLTFGPGELSKSISVALPNDSVSDGDKTVLVALTGKTEDLGNPALFTVMAKDLGVSAPSPSNSGGASGGSAESAASGGGGSFGLMTVAALIGAMQVRRRRIQWQAHARAAIT